ncbi:MAG: hypothetical protein Q7S87_03455 [Agitococcus sp.]|nr:hypothetical protein [Agitococcus sp.]MDO9178693.1 hypothetical protein [Agitococcus sp.]
MARNQQEGKYLGVTRGKHVRRGFFRAEDKPAEVKAFSVNHYRQSAKAGYK